MKHEVLGIGAPFLDHVIHVTDEYLALHGNQKGGMQPVDLLTFRKIIEESGVPVSLSAGGSSANTIKGLSKLGHSCALAGKIGKDDAGKAFLERIKHYGITPFLLPTDTPTGQIVCLVTPDKQRTFRDYLGAAQEMRGADLKPHFFEEVKLVHIEGYSLMYEDLPLTAMKMAKEAGALVSFDMASFEIADLYQKETFHLLENHVDIFFANVDETYALTRLPPDKGCAVLKEKCKIAVVLVGKAGCWIGHENELIHCLAYPVEPVDTTGAGDLFAAGFLHGYLLGKPLHVCAHYGALTASEVVQVIGAEIPDETWEKLLQDIEL